MWGMVLRSKQIVSQKLKSYSQTLFKDPPVDPTDVFML